MTLPKPVSKGPKGEYHDEKTPLHNRVQKEAPRVGFFQMFRFASGVDILCMILGTLGAIVLGAALPFNFLVYGRVMDALLYHVMKNQNESSVLLVSHYKDYSGNTTVFEDVSKLIPYFCYIGVAAFIAGCVQMTFWVRAAEGQVYRMRMKLFHSIITKQIGWFDRAKVGYITTTLTDDLQTIEAGISDRLACFIQWMTTFFAGFLLGFIHGWKLALVILGSSPLIIIAGATLALGLRRMSKKEQQAYGEAGAVAEEALSAIKTVTAFSGQDKEVERYSSQLHQAKAAGIQKSLFTGLGTGFVWTVMLGIFGVAFWYGTKLVGLGQYTGGEVVQVFFECMAGAFYFSNSLSLLQFFSQAQASVGKIYQILDQVYFGCLTGALSMGEAITKLQFFFISQSTACRVFQLIDEKSEIDPLATEGTKPEKLHGNISFKKVDFCYPSRPECQVLNHLSFDVSVGQTVAVVGPSGSGKSTIVQLLQRFYNIEKGEIEVDGYNIEELNTQWLRERLGVVSQEPVLFNASIRENIAYGREGANMADIQHAALIANAHSFIEELPQQYDTMVGERGTQLSGGQKQRLAIARALLRKPRILLLDEATSALDMESEAVVQTALEKASEGRTTIVVAHRLSTIRNADQIVVINKGCLEEVGTHEDLLKTKGLYHNLVSKQNKATEKMKAGEEEDIVRPELDEDQSEKKVGEIQSAGSERDKRSGLKKPQQKVEETELLPKPSLKRIMRLNAPEWPYIVLGCLLAIVAGALFPSFALIVAELLNNFGAGNAPKQLKTAGFLSGLIVVAAVSCGLAFTLQSYFFGIAGENLTLRMRKLTFAAILKQEMAWFDNPRHTVGALTVRLATDASLIKGAAIAQISNAIQNLSTITIALSVSFTFGWKLAFVVVGFFPLVALSHFIQGKMSHSLGSKNKSADEEGARIALEAVQNIRTVATLCRERNYTEQYKKYYKATMKRGRSAAVVLGLTQGFAQSIMFFCYAATYSFGSYLMSKGQLTFLNMIRVYMSISMGGLAIGRSTSLGHDLGKARLAAAKIFHLIDRKSQIDPSNDEGTKPVICSGDVEFQSARFTYPSRPDVEVLKGLTLKIGRGKTVALVGTSGCGKSTAVGLIQRFYNLDSGNVCVSGQSCRELNTQWLRAQLGLVSQEPTLFNMSIKYNIEYGDNTREVTMSDVVKAARMANIHGFIETLPLGYDTVVGDQGIMLSGGQKQRIAIARALVRNPKILLLDEATSALDAESEQLVQSALDCAAVGRTCIVIAHRLSTIQNADCIAVIKRGVVMEQGSHQELINKHGLYYMLHETQKRKKRSFRHKVDT